jgi:hypothetical protein
VSGWVSGSTGPIFISGWELVSGYVEVPNPVEVDVETAMIGIKKVDITNPSANEKIDIINIGVEGLLLIDADKEKQQITISSHVIDDKL